MTRRDGVAASSYHAAVKPHPRIRKFFKWSGLVVSVVLVTVWVGSAYGWCLHLQRRAFVLDVFRGQCMYQTAQAESATRPTIDSTRPTIVKWTRPSPRGFNWSCNYGGTPYWGYVVIPLWPFVLISIAITAAAWRMDTLAQRRKRIGGCPACGYDRAGLAADAPCPECNAKA